MDVAWSNGSLLSQCLQRIAGHAHDAPFVHEPGAEALIEVDGGLVPVEYVPLQTGAVTFDGDGGDADEQSLADAASAGRGLYEEVFEVDARAFPGGVDGKEEGQADGPFIERADQALEERTIAEAVAEEVGFRDGDFSGGAFVSGEIADELENQRHIMFLCRPNRQSWHQ